MDLITARDISPTSNHITVIAGPPGLGKSRFCGSIGEVVPPEEVLLIATLEREVKSVLYQKYNYDTVLCTDPDWNPARKQYSAVGFQKLLDTLEELRSDTKYSAVILDSGTEAGELAWHDALATFGVGTASSIKGGSYPAYDKMSTNMEQVIRSLCKLAGHKAGGSLIEKPKIVLMTWHIQPPKESPLGESADESAEGVEYEGKVLPQIRGAFRRRLPQYVDGMVYVDRTRTRTGYDYTLQIKGDREKHCKFPVEVPEGVDTIPNDYKAYHKIIADAVGG